MGSIAGKPPTSIARVWIALTWGVLAGFYLFLAGTADTVELIAMLVCCSAGAALAFGLSQVAREHFALRPPPRAILKPLASALPELFAVGRELAGVALHGAGRHRGEWRHQPFRFGDDTPGDAGRRALTTLGLSLAPRGFLVRGERENGTLLLHDFPAKPVSPDETWPA